MHRNGPRTPVSCASCRAGGPEPRRTDVSSRRCETRWRTDNRSLIASNFNKLRAVTCCKVLSSRVSVPLPVRMRHPPKTVRPALPAGFPRFGIAIALNASHPIMHGTLSSLRWAGSGARPSPLDVVDGDEAGELKGTCGAGNETQTGHTTIFSRAPPACGGGGRCTRVSLRVRQLAGAGRCGGLRENAAEQPPDRRRRTLRRTGRRRAKTLRLARRALRRRAGTLARTRLHRIPGIRTSSPPRSTFCRPRSGRPRHR